MIRNKMNRRDFLGLAGKCILALSGAGIVLPLEGCGKRENDKNDEERLRIAILSYLAQPRFTNKDFIEQITGTKAKLQLYDLNENKVYFSLPKEYFNERTLEKLTEAPKTVEFGKLKENRIVLGSYSFTKPENYFFRFDVRVFKVNKNKKISINYGAFDYDISMQELVDFIENESIYGGYLLAKNGEIVIANHGVMVARKGEPSLTRLVSKITRKNEPEKKAQDLLDFVTKQIEYDRTEAINKKEVLKRPNEVLMSRKSDCSGKIILYASLLEQDGINCRLVYFDKHIAVAVNGNFNNNGFNFKIDNEQYSIAETTIRGFQIEKSFMPVYKIKDIKYIQKPGENSKLMDARTSRVLEFVRN